MAQQQQQGIQKVEQRFAVLLPQGRLVHSQEFPQEAARADEAGVAISDASAYRRGNRRDANNDYCPNTRGKYDHDANSHSRTDPDRTRRSDDFAGGGNSSTGE